MTEVEACAAPVCPTAGEPGRPDRALGIAVPEAFSLAARPPAGEKSGSRLGALKGAEQAPLVILAWHVEAMATTRRVAAPLPSVVRLLRVPDAVGEASVHF